jgi:type IV secretory pathway TrbD component
MDETKTPWFGAPRHLQILNEFLAALLSLKLRYFGT